MQVPKARLNVAGRFQQELKHLPASDKQYYDSPLIALSWSNRFSVLHKHRNNYVWIDSQQ